MKRRFKAAVALAAAFGVAVSISAGGASSAENRATATTLTVWLQVDAEKSWPGAVAAATRSFKAQHPDVDVNVQYQLWTDHLTKLDASIAGNNAPDVVEMGNTEMMKYMAAGAFADLTSAKTRFPNSRTWLKGLEGDGTYRGKLFGVPYYAGARAVIYRKDYFRQAGIKKVPRTLDQFVATGQKLMKKFGNRRGFSAHYFPGMNWHAGLMFVYDYGGQIAVRKGNKWQGALDSPQAIRGLTKLKSVMQPLSRASKTTDEAHPFPSIPFARGRVASFIGNGWEWPYTLDEKVGNPKLKPVMGAFPMPSHIKGRSMPTLLGGSNLAVPVTSRNRSLAIDWIRAFTSSENQRVVAAAGNIANTTTLLGVNKTKPNVAPFEKAAKFSWSVPSDPNWTNVEKAKVLETMLSRIFTGRASVKSAAQKASKEISDILNNGR
jgi:N,N'-diacetylchitobiose transport system substrate-binding protein